MAPTIQRMCPFFAVRDVEQTVAFYRDKLGFETWYQPAGVGPLFAIVGRDGAMLFLKEGSNAPLPNATRDQAIQWDAYVLVDDPDALAAEFETRGAEFHLPVSDTMDGLRGFEIADPDGYVLFFGRPR